MLIKILHHKSHVIQLNHLLERQAAGPVAEIMCLVPRPTDNQPIWHELRLCWHHHRGQTSKSLFLFFIAGISFTS